MGSFCVNSILFLLLRYVQMLDILYEYHSSNTAYNIILKMKEADMKINSDDYKSCVQLKEKMSTNKEICELVEKIKILQKKYVRENDEEVLEELKSLEGRLKFVMVVINLIIVKSKKNIRGLELNIRNKYEDINSFYKVLND